MKYRFKQKNVVDAIQMSKNSRIYIVPNENSLMARNLPIPPGSYFVQFEDGETKFVTQAEFERDYEPAYKGWQ